MHKRDEAGPEVGSGAGGSEVRAVLVTSSFLPGMGGIESYLAELCDELAPQLAVLAPSSRDGRSLPTDLGYSVEAGPGRMLWPDHRVLRAIERAAQSHDTNRVLFGTPWPLALLGPALARRGLRYAVIVHGAEFLIPAAIPLLRRRVARALSGAELLLPVSRYTQNQIEAMLSRSGLHVPPMEVLRARVDLDRFHPDIDTSAVNERYGIDPDRKVVLCFGRLVKRKGVHRLVEAASEIVRRVPEALIVVAGTGPEEATLKRLGGRAPVRVLFTGRVPDELAPALYARADVFCLPVADRWRGLEVEGLGVVLLEAAACGVPCVTGRSGGTPEAVLDGKTGFVIDATDKAELVDAICRLLEDPELASNMGAVGREHVLAEFARRTLPPALSKWLDGDF